MMKKLVQSVISLIIIVIIITIGHYGLVENHINDPLSNAFESYHTEDFYYWLEQNARTETLSPFASDIVLVDMANIYSRTRIADIIDTIAAVSPRAVIVDMIFPPLSGADKAEDIRLTDAMRHINHLVIATNHYQDGDGNWQHERSFFADSVDAIEGHAWLRGPVVRNFTPYDLLSDSTLIPTLGTCIAQALGYDNIPLTTEQQYTIGYTPMEWMTWHVSREKFDVSCLHDKVVVIGDCGSLRDYHNVPALSGCRARQPGVNIHIRIALNEILAIHISAMPKWLSIGIQVLFLWCLCFLFCCPLEWGYNELIQLFIQLLMTVVVILVGWTVFHLYHCVMPLSLFLVGTLLTPVITDIVLSTTDCIHSRRQKRKARKANQPTKAKQCLLRKLRKQPK